MFPPGFCSCLCEKAFETAFRSRCDSTMFINAQTDDVFQALHHMHTTNDCLWKISLCKFCENTSSQLYNIDIDIFGQKYCDISFPSKLHSVISLVRGNFMKKGHFLVGQEVSTDTRI